jgi:hypothetical protein
VEIGFFSEDSGALYPKVVKLQCQLAVQHQHRLGWDSTGQPFLKGTSSQADPAAPQGPLMSQPEAEADLLQSVNPRAEQEEAEL